MFRKAIPLALALVLASGVSAQAEDGKLKTAAKQVGFAAKKLLVAPLWIGGGALLGGIAWYHLGGHISDIRKALRGGV
jgi:hypothetical protein